MAEAFQTKKFKQQEQEQEKQQQQQQQQQQIEEEIVDLQAFAPQRSFYDRIREQVERFATTTLGQYVIVRGDRALKAIEDTAKWSVPQEKTSCPLERPLPWLPFLMLIVLLRLIRVWLSVGALMIGNGPVSAADLVYFLQVRRRKLRAIRVHGLKTKHQREQESLTIRSNSRVHSLAGKLRVLLSQAVCQPGLRQDTASNHVFVMKSGIWREPAELLSSGKSASKRAADADDELDEHNLTLEQMLAKYANENSEDDSDFVPDEHNLSSEDTSTDSESDATEDTQPENGLHDEAKKSDSEKAHDKSIIIKENGTRPLIMPKPLVDIKSEPISDVDSASEQTAHNGAKERQSQLQSQSQSVVAHENAHTPNQHALKAVADQDVQQKSTPGHVSAAAVNTCLFSNTAAAATTDKHEPASELELVHKPQTESEPNVTKNTVHICTDSEHLAQSPPPASRIPVPVPVIQNESDLSATPFEAKGVLSINAKPTLDTLDCNTLTPATSTEDIFYSPIGSPIEFHAPFLPQSILKNTALPSVVVNAHSTPNSELESVENELPTKKHVTLPQQQQQNHKQQQHQHNNHTRYRGRNRH